MQRAGNTGMRLDEGQMGSKVARKKIKSCEKIDSHEPAEPADCDAFPKTTYLVLRFAPGIDPKALQWLIKKIKGPREKGGGELLLRRQPGCDEKDGAILHISATAARISEAAEELDLRLIGQNDPLSSSERRLIVLHGLMQGIRALPEDDHIPSYPTARLYNGQSIIEVFHEVGLLESFYPLHNKENLRRLRKQWYCNFFSHQPIDEIRAYFGDAIAMYFSFLGFYTTALLFPMLLGLVQMWFSGPESLLPAIFTILNSFWVILFLVLWKRHSNCLAYSWNTIKTTGLDDEPRANFRGLMGKDRVTGRLLPQYPRWKSFVKMYAVSWPIALVCAAVAFYIMLASFWAEQIILVWGTMQEDGTQSEPDLGVQALVMIPSIVYTALVFLMNFYYRKLATWLTEWENHRTQSQFDRHRVLKLVVFEFVNNFMALFYIAFVYQDIEMLRYQIALMLILLQFLNHFQEAIIPYFLLKYARKVSILLGNKTQKDHDSDSSSAEEDTKPILPYEDRTGAKIRRRQNSISLGSKSKLAFFSALTDTPELDVNDVRVLQTVAEGERDEYESTYDDYLELFIQFGYVILFSSVYPAAAICAVVNNVLEVRADAFKLCRVTRRPLPKRVKDVGAWQRAFEAVGVISICTNCALLYLMPGLRENLAPGVSELNWALATGALEHALIALGLLLYLAVPSQPEWVRVALARQNYQSTKALKLS
ncbi:anoctamin-10 isoform X2 [Neocloeon triangulifer]|uniref:anoctamin-10 isoform X2 n=1 Tax=Neocloeon triangulifer TaxID=2078957 RepID=UPI00286F456B|nr:anoctamin-10 isoform X2 [Neocloeon triangulifer]